MFITQLFFLTSETPNGIFPTYNRRDWWTTWLPSTGVAAAVFALQSFPVNICEIWPDAKCINQWKMKEFFFFLLQFTLHSFILNRCYMFKTNRWNIPIFVFFNYFFFGFIFFFWTIFRWTWTTRFISISVLWWTSTFTITFMRTWTITMTTRFTISWTWSRWTAIISL